MNKNVSDMSERTKLTYYVFVKGTNDAGLTAENSRVLARRLAIVDWLRIRYRDR